MKRLLFVLGWLIIFPTVQANEVLYYWSGALTTSSIKVNAVLQKPSDKVRLMISVSGDMQNPVYSEYRKAPIETGHAVSLEVSGLSPGQTYYYTIEADGKPDLSPDDIGQFTTLKEGPFSFRFAVGSCSFFPNNPVYDEMRNASPLFLVVTGDLHYANPSSTQVQMHRDAYENRVLSHDKESRFFQVTPFAYVWDDHDFCGDNNVGSDGCGAAAKQAYTEYIPHYPLSAPAGANSIYQAFSAGRIRFIMSDLRSERITGDIMSREQIEWLKSEMLQARDNGQIIAWVSSVSFSGSGKDNWGGFTSTREEMANFFRDSMITNMFILSGDAHMLAIDNGDNSDFSTGRTNVSRYPIFQAAALNNVGSDKGGTFSEGGTFPNPPLTSQWGIVDVEDNGGNEICITFHGYRLSPVMGVKGELIKYSFCRTLPAP